MVLLVWSGTGVVHAEPPVDALQTAVQRFASDEPIYHEQKLTASNGAASDWFGESTALSADGKTLLVGAPYANVSGKSSQGYATVFVLTPTGWVEQATLLASDGAADATFGKAVALSADGNIALVGAIKADNRGAGYIFTRSGTVWTQGPKLTAASGAVGDFFGYSAALSADGTTALLGAPCASVGANADQGAVFVFKNGPSGWSEEKKLTASDGVSDDQLGISLAISSDGLTVIAGAFLDDVGTNKDQGSAYIFSASSGSWVEQQKITASDGATFDTFSYSIAMSGDGRTVLVGAPSKGVYIYTLSAGVWGGQIKLTASDSSWFGRSVAISGDNQTILVGANATTIGANSAQGALYLFGVDDAGSWAKLKKVFASDGQALSQLGSSVALSYDAEVLIGGASKDMVGTNFWQGSVYSFAMDAPPRLVSIERANESPTNDYKVQYTVTFSEPVTGVDLHDFTLTIGSGISDAALSAVNGSGAVYTVNLLTGSGLGTLRMDMTKTATVYDTVGNKLAGLPYTGPEYIRGKRHYCPLVMP
jgi:hypothetical protein